MILARMMNHYELVLSAEMNLEMATYMGSHHHLGYQQPVSLVSVWCGSGLRLLSMETSDGSLCLVSGDFCKHKGNSSLANSDCKASSDRI